MSTMVPCWSLSSIGKNIATLLHIIAICEQISATENCLRRRHQTTPDPSEMFCLKISWAVLKPPPKEVDRTCFLNEGCLKPASHRGRSTQGRKGYGQGLPVLLVVPAETATATPTPTTPIIPTSATTATTTGVPTANNNSIDKDNDNTRLLKDY